MSKLKEKKQIGRAGLIQLDSELIYSRFDTQNKSFSS